MKFGDNFYKLQSFLNLEKEAWDRLILLYEARKRRIKVSNNEVVDKIKEFPFMQTNGKFDSKLYQNVLGYIFKTTARKFEEEIRQSLMFEKLYDDTTAGVTVHEKEIVRKYKEANEKIKVGYVPFLTKDFQDKVSVEEIELKDYFEMNSSDFKKPPVVNVQYIGIDYPKDPTEEDKKTAKEKITEIYSNLGTEKVLEKISAQYALPIKETGFFSFTDPLPELGIQFDFIQTAFSLKTGQISEPVLTTKGIYILKLKEKKDSHIPTFEEIKESVEKTLKSKKATKLAKEKTKEYLVQFEEAYKNNPNKFDLKKAAKRESLSYQQTPLLKLGEYIPDVGASEDFLDEAFSLKEDESKALGLVSTEQGAYIIKVEEFVPIDEKEFEEVKKEFKNKLLQNKKDEAFNKFFLRLKEQAKLEDNISEVKSTQQ